MTDGMAAVFVTLAENDWEHDSYREKPMTAMMQGVLAEVQAERYRQEELYKHNDDLVDGTGPKTRWLLPYSKNSAAVIELELRDDYLDYVAEVGAPTWCHLVREEIAEAFQEEDPSKLAHELIQVAALCVSWVERIRAGQLAEMALKEMK